MLDRISVDSPVSWSRLPLRVESLLVGLAGLRRHKPRIAPVRLDVGDGRASAAGSPGRNSTPSTPEVMSSGNEPWPAAMGGTPSGHGLDGDEAERLLPGGRQHHRARPGHQLGAPVAARPARASRTEGRADAQAATSRSSGPRSGDDQAQPRVTGRAAVAVPAGHQQAARPWPRPAVPRRRPSARGPPGQSLRRGMRLCLTNTRSSARPKPAKQVAL